MSLLDLPTLPARAVLDTNVVMALWHFGDPALGALAQAIRSGQLQLISRPACLAELERVLAYRQFAIAADAQTAVVAAYRSVLSELPERAPPAPEKGAAIVLPQCRDHDDQKFLELAWDGGAQLLVTRDKLLLKLARRPLLRDRFHIITPEKLCALLAPAIQVEA